MASSDLHGRSTTKNHFKRVTSRTWGEAISECNVLKIRVRVRGKIALQKMVKECELICDTSWTSRTLVCKTYGYLRHPPRRYHSVAIRAISWHSRARYISHWVQRDHQILLWVWSRVVRSLHQRPMHFPWYWYMPRIERNCTCWSFQRPSWSAKNRDREEVWDRVVSFEHPGDERGFPRHPETDRNRIRLSDGQLHLDKPHSTQSHRLPWFLIRFPALSDYLPTFYPTATRNMAYRRMLQQHRRLCSTLYRNSVNPPNSKICRAFRSYLSAILFGSVRSCLERAILTQHLHFSRYEEEDFLSEI